jgi:hypothetical protein
MYSAPQSNPFKDELLLLPVSRSSVKSWGEIVIKAGRQLNSTDEQPVAARACINSIH